MSTSAWEQCSRAYILLLVKQIFIGGKITKIVHIFGKAATKDLRKEILTNK